MPMSYVDARGLPPVGRASEVFPPADRTVARQRDAVGSPKSTARIARIWRGRTRRDRADAYEVYLYEAGIRVLADAALAVESLRDDGPTETEFVTISYWESIAAMARYAGDDPRRIHHLTRDAEFLLALLEAVQVLSIRAAYGAAVPLQAPLARPSALGRVSAWMARHRTERQLARLPDALLADTGFERADPLGRPQGSTQPATVDLWSLGLEPALHDPVVPAAAALEASSSTPRIARVWRGRTRRDQADAYEAYLHDASIRVLADRALGVQSCREDGPTETEFVTISYWEGIAAMARYAGDDPRRIHHLPRDPEFLLTLPEAVQVLAIGARHVRQGCS